MTQTLRSKARLRDRRPHPSGWARGLVRDPKPCDPRYEPPASDPAWLAEALKYARNQFEEDVLKGIIPLSLKGWMHGKCPSHRLKTQDSTADDPSIPVKEITPAFRSNRERLKELLTFLAERTSIPLSIAVRNRKEFVLVLGWRPEDLDPEVSPGVVTRRHPSYSWCPIPLTGVDNTIALPDEQYVSVTLLGTPYGRGFMTKPWEDLETVRYWADKLGTTRLEARIRRQYGRT